MISPGKAKLMRILIDESNKWEHKPLYEALVMKAREHGLSGATVTRGEMGFGGSSHIHTAKILRLSADLPIQVDLIDTQEKIRAFLPVVEEMVREGIVTLLDMEVVFCRQHPTDEGDTLV